MTHFGVMKTGTGTDSDGGRSPVHPTTHTPIPTRTPDRHTLGLRMQPKKKNTVVKTMLVRRLELPPWTGMFSAVISQLAQRQREVVTWADLHSFTDRPRPNKKQSVQFEVSPFTSPAWVLNPSFPSHPPLRDGDTHSGCVPAWENVCRRAAHLF